MHHPGGQAGEVRTKDVRGGQTYRCEVPYTLPTRRYGQEPSFWQLLWLRGKWFHLTVTDVDLQARTVQGLRIGSTSRITVELTDDQAEAAGLPPGRAYRVEGRLTDPEGEPVEIPALATLTVPIRWLHPLDSPPPAYGDASLLDGWNP